MWLGSPAPHILMEQETERRQEVGYDYKTSGPSLSPRTHLLQAKIRLLKVPQLPKPAPPRCAPGTQTPEPVGDIPQPTHTSMSSKATSPEHSLPRICVCTTIVHTSRFRAEVSISYPGLESKRGLRHSFALEGGKAVAQRILVWKAD